jgi:hypothetical protein
LRPVTTFRHPGPGAISARGPRATSAATCCGASTSRSTTHERMWLSRTPRSPKRSRPT